MDSIVEDLNQQDVLPSDQEPTLDNDLETILDTESQASNWGEPVGELGHRAVRSPLEDEVKASEVLVSQGLTEADEELRELEEQEELEDEKESQ